MCIILTYIANYAEERIVTDNTDEILWGIADSHPFDGEREIGRLSAEEKKEGRERKIKKKKGKEEMEYIRKDHDMNFLVLLLGELR